MDKTNYGDNLRAAREALCLTQKDVGRMVGLSRSSVSAWEIGERYPRPYARYMLFTELGLDLRTLALPQQEGDA